MSIYEGLNLPDLFELMHELVPPEPTSLWPQTSGWLLLMAWLLTVVALLLWHGYRRWRANQYRREALATLRTLERAMESDPAGAAATIAELLKRTALAAYPRRQVASLYGPQWADFLCQSAGQDPLVTAAATTLAAAAYRKNTDARPLLAPARRWIEVHRA